MSIDSLPEELFSRILLLAAEATAADGPTFSFGLTDITHTLEPHKARPAKYVRGPFSPQDLRWHSASNIRQVCSKWHTWALDYALEHLMIQMWRGEQRWLELPRHIRQYGTYEIMNRQIGHVVWCPGHTSLQQTDSLLSRFPIIGASIRRLWFNGLHLATTDRQILSVISHCPALRFLSVPWTLLRRGSPEEWVQLLKTETPTPLFSLEIQSVCLREYKAEALEEEAVSRSPLADPRVDFRRLKRLKIFGNTLSKPIGDRDLTLIARTAIGLESLDITNNSTTTVAGMLALVEASSATLQVLEHSPRSDDGFFHPFPGNLQSGHHLCTVIANLPRMRDLSLSLPHMCHALFQNVQVKWLGECQVRSSDLCGCSSSSSSPTTPGGSDSSRKDKLRKVLHAARHLIAERARMQNQLSLEIFFNHCIFEPELRTVHGDFVVAEVRSNGQWPVHRQSSTKGPYGTSGVYGKNEGPWDMVTEDEYFVAIEKGWIKL